MKKLAYAVLAALLAAISVTVAITIPTPGDGPDTTITIRVDGADRDSRPDDPLVLGEQAQEVRENTAGADTNLDVAEPMRGPDKAPAGKLDGPLAAQEWPGCKTAFVRAFSSRRGVTPRAIALHYTAGGNIPGWADLDGLTGYSNNLRNGVSWHFGVDREGHCTYNVPVNHKAWTIAGLNSQTINLEIVGRGNEPDYAGLAGAKTVARIVKRLSTLYGIPIRLGAVANCIVTRTGIITHHMGGSCSGGHRDVLPYELARIIATIRDLADVPDPRPKPKLKPRPACSPLNVEKALAKRYPAAKIVVDGRLGDRSRATIRRFQRGRGLDADGIVGPQTGAALGLKRC